ncbi:hypothetical protein BT63DRAFT_305255 [Microthyrium microscopicum]|uniref:Uncharacterized protein n=1 Tax=Microthyrium microscopicum TaxID=703497 RepID=A0A6A6U9Y0_9PEZI|nr:hypothetical protein BT63DRAFT_305255 [Microthyrium microscopicum]
MQSFSSSPKSSSPICVGWPSTSPPSSNNSAASSVSSTYSTNSTTWTSSSSYKTSMSCAFPSWPSRNSLSPPLKASDSAASYSSNNNAPSSYISDFDLFPEDLADECDVPFLDEAPAPPRDYILPPAAVPLMPLFAPAKPTFKKRRRSSKKSRPMGKPMTPISECPIAAPE